MLSNRTILSLILALIQLLLPWSLTAQGGYAHFEGRHTHPIAFIPEKSILLALNTPDARLSVFDVSKGKNSTPAIIAEIPVGLEPVSIRVWNQEEVWVVNELSDSISIVSLSGRVVVETLQCPDEPADLVFAGGKAFVSCARSNQIRVFDVLTRSEVGTISLKGINPRALAVDATGSTVFAAFQHSGNRTTVLRAASAPPQPAPANTKLDAPPQTALIVPADDTRIQYTVLDHDVAEISVQEQRVVRYLSDMGTSLFDLALRPGANELWVANTEARNLIRFEPNLRGHVADNRVTRHSLASGLATPFDLNPGLDYSALPNPKAREVALAQPMALVFEADGGAAWIAAFASDRVAKIDSMNGGILSRTYLRSASETSSRKMRGPRGLALDEREQRLFVLNKLANTLTVIDTATGQISSEIPIGTYDPTPQNVKEGRGFLFDARLSGNGTVSCGTCHIDGDRDGLAWDLGDPAGEMDTVIGANLAAHDTRPQQRAMHPMKGPMITQTLRGLSTNQLLHWRGDRANIQAFNPTFDKLMGGSQLTDLDMAAMKDYLDTLKHHPNPNRNRDNSLPAALNGGIPSRGAVAFSRHVNHCSICHVGPSGTDNNIDDMRNLAAPQPLRTPPLQTTYQRMDLDTRPGATNVAGFGLGHDGAHGKEFLPTVHFYELDELTIRDFADVTAYVLSFDTGTAPAVGFSRTVSETNRDNPQVLSDIALLESQSALGSACDLVVRGKVGGETQHFLYNPGAQRYIADNVHRTSLSRTQLLSTLGAQDALTFMGVPSGSGRRFGVDRNEDGILNRNETRPTLELIGSPPNIQFRWLSQGGWIIEKAPSLAGQWEPVAAVMNADGTSEYREGVLSNSSQFFRLRRVW